MVFTKKVDQELKTICFEIEKRYDLYFIEIGTDKDHVHFLIQSIPMYQPTKIVRIVKSITAREMFARIPEVKHQLWGGQFWSEGYFINTVGKHNSENAIVRYIKEQGREKEYTLLHKSQLKLFVDTPQLAAG